MTTPDPDTTQKVAGQVTESPTRLRELEEHQALTGDLLVADLKAYVESLTDGEFDALVADDDTVQDPRDLGDPA